MNKGDLVDNLVNSCDMNKTSAETAVNAILASVAEALVSGDKLTLVGFGTFSVSERPARTGRHPQTGASMEIPAKKVVKFKAGKQLEDSIQ